MHPFVRLHVFFLLHKLFENAEGLACHEARVRGRMRFRKRNLKNPCRTLRVSCAAGDFLTVHSYDFDYSLIAFASFGQSLMEKLSLPMRSFPRQITLTTSPRVRTSSTWLMRSFAILEM